MLEKPQVPDSYILSSVLHIVISLDIMSASCNGSMVLDLRRFLEKTH